MKPTFDTSDRLILALLLVLVLFGTLSFFVNPAYEKGVWAVVTILLSSLSAVMAFKFGVHVPKADPPDNGTVDTTTQVVAHLESDKKV